MITGVAGFIGSGFADRLLKDGWQVVGIDNFSTGRREFLRSALAQPGFRLVEMDLMAGPEAIRPHVKGADQVFHFAANADVKDGLLHPRKDLEQNTIVTWNVLEAMRLEGAKRIAFSSTGSVYGESKVFPTPEDAPFPAQTSLYGASKLAGEALIAAYAEGYGMKAHVFRFVSILGDRYTHGHVIDFVRQLRKDPTRLKVLGNGKQRKSYLHVQDCISAVLAAIAHPTDAAFEVYNLGTDEYTEVNQSIEVICAALGVKPKLEYAGGERGWVGDNPFIFLDTKKIRSIGWRSEKSILESVRLTVDFLVKNPEFLVEAKNHA
jgi:UDP-glucose 4-epimerase